MECPIASSLNLVAYAVWIRKLERVVDGRTIYGIAKDTEYQRDGRVEVNVTQAPGRDYRPISRNLVNEDENDLPIAPCP